MSENPQACRSEGMTREAFVNCFRDVLAQEPESGYSFPNENAFRAILANPNAATWVAEEFVELGDYAGKILHLLSHMPLNLIEPWFYDLARKALASKSVMVRDAVICALEYIETPDAMEILRAHDEPNAWLRDYLARVLEVTA